MLHPLYLISFITGFTDPGTYGVFQTFASNQTGWYYHPKHRSEKPPISFCFLRRTGNVILLTVEAAAVLPINIQNSGTSLAAYLVTGFLGGQLAHRVGLRRKWWLVTSNAIQTLLLVVACLVERFTGMTFETPGTQWIFLLLLAASSGLQVAISRNCGNGEVPTAMLSSPM
jgi:hypothetical protein